MAVFTGLNCLALILISVLVSLPQGSTLDCFTCEVGVNGATDCPTIIPAAEQPTTCGLTDTFCERIHDSKSGAVKKRGCASVCFSIGDMLPTPEITALVEYFMGEGTGCCQVDQCNPGSRAVASYTVFALALCIVMAQLFGQ